MGIIITIILLILLPFSVSAQTVSGKCTDALSLALARGTDHLTTSSLSSQKGFLPKFSYSEIAVGSQYETGSLHRPQTGEDILDINFDALGGRRLGKFFLDGGFSFRQRFENNVKFASTFDPLRGNPYYIADSTGGDWRKQSYNLWADVAFNVLDDRLTAGLGLDVEVGRGAKKIDPRPLANTNRITVEPSLSYNAYSFGIFSLSMVYSVFKESSNLILYDSSQPQKLYLMKGLGQYVYEVFSNTERERKFDGDDIGLRFGYLFRKNGLSASLSGSWTNSFEKVYDIDYSKPHTRGKYYDNRLDAVFRLSSVSTGAAHDFFIGIEDSRASGRELVQVFDSSPEVNAWVTDSEIPGRYLYNELKTEAGYSLWLKKGGKPLWRFDITADYLKSSQMYAAMSSFMDYERLETSLSAAKVFYVRSGYFKIGLRGYGGFCIDSGMEYRNREDDSTIGDGLIGPDFRVLTSNVFGGGIDLVYSLKTKKQKSIDFSVSSDYLHSPKTSSGTLQAASSRAPQTTSGIPDSALGRLSAALTVSFLL